MIRRSVFVALVLMVAVQPMVWAEDGGDSFVVRLGVEYGFDIGEKWEAAPSGNFDITDEDTAIVIDVGFGRHF